MPPSSNGHFAHGCSWPATQVGLSAFSTGKSVMVSKTALARSGGYAAAGDSMCEDAIVQRGLKATGQRVTLSHEPVRQPIGRRRAAEVWHRHVRWASCRRRYAPLLFGLEMATATPVAALAGGLASAGLGTGFATGLVVTIALQLGLERAFLTLARWPVSLGYPAAWATRELLALPLGIAALLPRRRTVWRKRALELRA